MGRATLTILVLLVVGVGATAAAQEPPRRGGTHTVRAGDTLWDLAREYLGDPFRWPALYEANRTRIAHPDTIYPGQELVIPAGEVVAAEAAVVEALEVQPAARKPAPEEPAVAAGLPPEAMERTVFHRTDEPVAVGTMVLTRPPEERPAVLAGDYYSAGWLEPEPGSRGLGVVASVAGGEEGVARTARPFDPVRIASTGGAAVEVGDRLLVVRVERVVGAYGRVVRPAGIVTVSRVDEVGIMAVVTTQFDRVLAGDQVRRLAPFEERTGVHPQPVEGGLEGRLLGFRDAQPVPGTGDVAYLDVGADRGVGVGDEFVVLAPAVEGGPPSAVGRLQVVYVVPSTSTARVVRADMPLAAPDLRVRLAAKMP